ncbi:MULTISPECIES: hypothetical protein [unclassified Mesorhizobium]|uniref:hypothetical protein n=1 Tax=unclassified Mesorhizobium TaxID=325217 RepID=UPI002415FCC2|nr:MULTISPECIES: hypothetical protein [unclassified Mesorhizobium]WFP65557.1 hypothetical protein QAZ47_13925 [Mesorhizobium sp. WSM4904]WFP78822.1 hypothetical protein QAZ22_13865 [Mesorhizobium sp. WSM4906]
MNLAYVVRCNFNDASREAAWNDWYSGPKLRQMLAKPHFLTVQRFRRVSGSGRNYLAFWTIASADAFTTNEYTSDWGFFEWHPYIVDWSRDLFEARNGHSVTAPKLRPRELLRLVSFEGASEAYATDAHSQIDAERPGTRWFRSVGLDRHTPLLGLSVEKSDTAYAAIAGVNEAFYEPISDLVITEQPEALPLVR